MGVPLPWNHWTLNTTAQRLRDRFTGAYTATRRHSCDQEMYHIKEVVRSEKNSAVNIRKLWSYE